MLKKNSFHFFSALALSSSLVVTSIASAFASASASAQNPRPMTQIQAERQFQRALLLAQRDQPEASHRILEGLRQQVVNQSKPLMDPHLLNLTEARVLFQMNRLNEVPGLYRSIPKSSPLWLEAREELAWAYLRQEKPEKALAELKSLMTSFFRNTVGSEVFVAAGLTHLSTCDYVSIFNLSKEFKQRFLPRVDALAALLNNSPESEALLNRALEALKKNSQLTLEPLLAQLPRKLSQDPLILQSLSQFPSEASRRSALRRSQQLARAELQEIKQNVQKVHLIEAEAIQRMALENRTARRDKVRSSGHPHQGEVLSFPATREVWRDEIGHFAVDLKECPPLRLAGR